MELLPSLLFLSWWWVFKRRSDCKETVWILLEAVCLNGIRTLSNDPRKNEFYSILDDRISRKDDEIIYYWCFNFVNFFYSTSSAAIIVLVKKFGELVEPPNWLRLCWMDDHVLTMTYKSLAMWSPKIHRSDMIWVLKGDSVVNMGLFALTI